MREIGSRRELFVDTWLIDQAQGAVLRLHSPLPRDTSLVLDKPWESSWAFNISMMQVDGEYRCYYRGFYDDTIGNTCVAFSQDGIHWAKPTLGLYEWNGSTANNIVMVGRPAGNFAPFLDPNPAATPAQRFKALGRDRRPGETREQRRWPHLYAYASPDGLRWERLREEPIISDGAFDSHNLAFWDSYRGHYVAFYRDFFPGEAGEPVRGIKWTTSSDFLTWTPGQWLDFGGLPPEHHYTNSTVSYPRAPHLYLAFPKRFVPGRKRIESHEYPGVSDGVFMSSRDGLHWHRFREAFVRPGRDWQNWTERNNYLAWGMYQTAPDELSMYRIEHYRHATCHLTRCTLRLDGFASLHADFPGGEVTTHPLTFSGNELSLNYATSAAGSVRVEIQDEQGQAIPGYSLDDCPEIYGDEIEGVVRWQGGTSVGALQGRPVRLRFALADADVYALQFRA